MFQINRLAKSGNVNHIRKNYRPISVITQGKSTKLGTVYNDIIKCGVINFQHNRITSNSYIPLLRKNYRPFSVIT